jgi:hypothetical protein
MKEKVPLTLACVAVLAFACGPRSSNGETATANTPVSGVNRSVSVDPRAPLTPTLEISVDDDVRFAFRVTNAGTKRVEVKFPSGLTHDVIVLDTLGREVWRWSNGRLFTQNVQNRVVRASDTMTFDEEWEDAAPGRYTAVVTLASVNFPLEHRAEFVVR